MRPNFPFGHLHTHESSRTGPVCNLRDWSAENFVHLFLGEGWHKKVHSIEIVVEVSRWSMFAALGEEKKHGE